MLWHLSLGCGVRTTPDLTFHVVGMGNGAVFVQAYGRIFMVPLLHYDGEAIEKLAKPLPRRVPDTLPFVPARAVFNQDAYEMPWLALDCDETHLQPPLFLWCKEELYLCT